MLKEKSSFINIKNRLGIKIVIDEKRNISIKFKFDVISKINFKCEHRYLVGKYYRKMRKKLNVIIIDFSEKSL